MNMISMIYMLCRSDSVDILTQMTTLCSKLCNLNDKDVGKFIQYLNGERRERGKGMEGIKEKKKRG
jgi:hypothetical protein